MARAQRPEDLNSDTETSFGWFSAELAGSGGTVGWNPDVWVWVGEEPGSGWAQPLDLLRVGWGMLSNPPELHRGDFQGFSQKHLAGNFGVWRLENKPSCTG